MSQTVTRGLSLNRKVYLYFESMCAKNIILEVDPEIRKYEYFSSVSAKGRIIDPKRMQKYSALLRMYKGEFFKDTSGPVRIIQVDFLPQQQKIGALMMYLLLLGLFLGNIFILRNTIKTRRQIGIQKK